MPIKYAWKNIRQYDQLEAGLLKYLHRARVNFILKIIDKNNELQKNDLTVLDLGCGDGILTKYLNFCKNFNLIGVDSDLDRLKRARSMLDNKIKLINADLSSLCFKNSKADIILLHHVIEHIEDGKSVLKSCFDILRTGGILILGIPNEGSFLGKISRILHKKLYENGEHFNFYNESAITKMLANEGFIIKKVGRIGFLFPIYYVHMFLIANPVTFFIGNFFTKVFKFTADSLIIVAQVKKSECQ